MKVVLRLLNGNWRGHDNTETPDRDQACVIDLEDHPHGAVLPAGDVFPYITTADREKQSDEQVQLRLQGV